MTLARPAMLYSGTCRLCRCAARVVAKVDRRQQLAFLPLEDEEASRLLAAVPEGVRTECWWLVLRDGTPVPGNRGGGVAILSQLHASRPLGLALRALGLSRVVDVADDLIAARRGTLGKLVPNGPAPRRYP